MGRATRWLKSLFGIKKDRENSTSLLDKKKSTSTNSATDSRGLCHNPATIPPNISPAEAAWLQSLYNQTEKEQSKHAIAVAAATAAAADAAVAAAQAAVAVVRLTGHGRGSSMLDGEHQGWAALKIQTVFRGYLARKALRALKGLVKLQAHVRGYLVRKQATETLLGMQALIRAQATVRSYQTRGLINKNRQVHRFDYRARKSMERFSDTGSESEHTGPPPISHSRRLSGSLDALTKPCACSTDHETPKIVEVDTGTRPRSKSRRNTSISDFGDDPQFQLPISSPLPCCTPARLSIPDRRNSREYYNWGLSRDEYRYSTAQSTPRFVNSSVAMPNAPLTPSKSSVCGDHNYFLRQFGSLPNYMTNTKSFNAKMRSHSAPKQRPDVISPKKRVSLNEMMESRISLSGLKMQGSCSHVQEAINFKNAVMGKLERSSEFVREPERYYLQRKWSRDCDS